MLICKFGRCVLWFVFFSLQKILPPTVQTNLGGRNFASCVALGRIFGATFRNACPPARAQLRPLRPKAAEQSRTQRRRRGAEAKVTPKYLPRATQDAKCLPTSGLGQQVRTKKSTRLVTILQKRVLFFVRAWPSANNGNCFRLLGKSDNCLQACTNSSTE